MFPKPLYQRPLQGSVPPRKGSEPADPRWNPHELAATALGGHTLKTTAFESFSGSLATNSLFSF